MIKEGEGSDGPGIRVDSVVLVAVLGTGFSSCIVNVASFILIGRSARK
jgi:hypothetical protein